MENTLFNEILQFVLIKAIEILLPIALGYVVLFINKKIAEARARTGAQQFDHAVSIVRQLVLAAEQAGITGKVEAVGEAKKQMVMGMAERELAKYGINIDADVLSTLVEAQVHNEFNKIKVDAQ